MALVSFSKKDLMRGKIITPGWYRVRIDEVGEAPSKDQKSTNFPVSATILYNADNGDKEFTDVPIDWNFNSKAMGFAVGYLKALGIEVEENKRYDLSQSAGSEIDVFIENDLYEGRMVNRVNHKYRAPRREGE